MRAVREPNTLIKRFVANDEPTIVVDSSCASAILEWTVGSPIDDTGGLQVVLAENGRPIARDLPARGSYSVKNRTTAVYTLSVRARSGSEASVDSQTLTLKRLPTLTVYFEDVPIKANTRIPFGVMISCPAPDRGLTVRLVSSDPTRAEGGEVEISPGSTWASTTLLCGVRTGEVEVTGIATGYLRDTVHLVVPADESELDIRAKWK